MDRDILHIYIPHFPITLARASNPSIRSRPVVIAPAHSERAPIWHISEEARSEGIHEGMPLFRARRLCPSLVILPPDPRRLSGGTRALVRLTQEYTPLWEPGATGRIYLDFTGSRRLFGPGRDAALRLKRELDRRLSLTGTVGVAGNKMVSRIAAGCLERPGICDVLRGDEAAFIAPLPAAVIPGIGSTRQQILLTDLNLKQVGNIAALTLPQLLLPFGPFAPVLYQRARGIDPSSVTPPRQTPELAEECHLEREENDDTILLAELYRLSEGCGIRLRRLGKEVSTLKLTVHYADGVSNTKSNSLAPSSSDDRTLFDSARQLYYLASERRVRVKSMHLLCEKVTETQQQMEMFGASAASADSEKLQGALDKVRSKYGTGAVQWGRTAPAAEQGTHPSTKLRAGNTEHRKESSNPGTRYQAPGTRNRP